jgi:hypothetical protein
MSQQIKRTFTAGEALTAYARVKVKSGTATDPVQVDLAGAGEQHIGVTEYAAASGDPVEVILNAAPRFGTAAEAFARGATLYGAAAGGIQDTSSGSAIGQALAAATASGDVVEFAPYQVLSTTAATVSVADTGSFTAATTVEAALAEIYQHLKSAQGFIPVPLTSLREVTTNDIPNAAGNGGVLATDSTPTLEYTNGDTDSCLRVLWAASNADPVCFQVPLPPDLNDAADVVIHFRAAMAGATDTPVLSADCFFNEGDTKVEDDSAAVTGTTFAEYTITVAAADVPAGAQTLSCELTPGAHTTDTLSLTALWIEYTRTILTS